MTHPPFDAQVPKFYFFEYIFKAFKLSPISYSRIAIIVIAIMVYYRFSTNLVNQHQNSLLTILSD